MAQKRHRMDPIISKLPRAEVEFGKAKKVPEVCNLIGIAEQTYYRWRKTGCSPLVIHARLNRASVSVS